MDALVLFFFFSFFKLKIKVDEIKKAERNPRKKTKIYIQQDRIGITLREHPGRADLPVPHYSPDGQSSREMALGVGH